MRTAWDIAGGAGIGAVRCIGEWRLRTAGFPDGRHHLQPGNFRARLRAVPADSVKPGTMVRQRQARAEGVSLDGGTGDDTTGGDGGLVEADPCEGRPVGTSVGNCATDFGLVDHTGLEVRLKDFAGDVIVLDLSSFT